jgi:hypothetical protein
MSRKSGSGDSGSTSEGDPTEPRWRYRGRDFTEEDAVGYAAFVYLITNLVTGRRYVGKKLFQRRITRQPLKGKTRKRRSVAASDWPSYWGSSTELLADIEKLGRSSFSREILRLCETRGESSYHEARIQLVEDVLLDPEGWYNTAIMLRVHRSHLRKKK